MLSTQNSSWIQIPIWGIHQKNCIKLTAAALSILAHGFPVVFLTGTFLRPFFRWTSMASESLFPLACWIRYCRQFMLIQIWSSHSNRMTPVSDKLYVQPWRFTKYLRMEPTTSPTWKGTSSSSSSLCGLHVLTFRLVFRKFQKSKRSSQNNNESTKRWHREGSESWSQMVWLSATRERTQKDWGLNERVMIFEVPIMGPYQFISRVITYYK